MNEVEFDKVVNGQIDICKSILLKKAGEYAADDDRLHNFKRAAGLTGDNPVKALSGMMLKHTVSVYDMCGDKDPSHFDMDLWDEKITDSINYLLLLKALIIDEKGDFNEKSYLKTCPECNGLMQLHNKPSNSSETSAMHAIWTCSICNHWEID